jgi:GMP synthase (glutamine-hydrolysing)
MHIDVLMHVPHEGPGNIAPWAAERGHHLTEHHLFEGEPPQAAAATDFLVVMGGPMNVYETDQYAWLEPEIELIAETIARGKPVLGICLGSQLIARALGAEVTENAEKEIGWFPVRFTSAFDAWLSDGPAVRDRKLEALRHQTVFHWHGDTFELPPSSIAIASSDACARQGFLYGENVLALQFHFEMSREGIEAICAAASDELSDARGKRYVQSQETMISEAGNFVGPNSEILWAALDRLSRASAGVRP